MLTGKIPFLFLLVVLFSGHATYCQVDCILKKSEDSILVYACKSPDSKLKSIRSTFSIKTTPAVLAAYMLDIGNFTKWQYNTIESKILKKIGANEIIYCSLIEAPWPVSNRDLVMHLKITQDPLTRVMTMELNSMPDFIPERKDVVRIPKAEGKWVVEPVGKNEILIHYSFLVDPGGSVPAWLINLAIAEGPFETFKNLKNRIYQGGKISPAAFIAD